MNDIKRRLANTKKEHRIIGFLGTDHGVGTTHIAIATATFLASELGRTVAFLELGGQPVLECLTHKAYDTSFEMDGIRYYPHAKTEQIGELCSAKIQYLILDFGCESTRMYGEFCRCDRSYLVGSFVPWKCGKLYGFMSKSDDQRSKDNICNAVLACKGYEHEKRKFERMYGCPVRTVPYIANPFWLVREQLPFFYHLL